MESWQIQALSGLGGVLLGGLIVGSVQFVAYYFSRDERWYRKNVREWKRIERARKAAAK